MSDDGEPTEVECPAEGCDYRNLKQSVCSHYSGKRDEKHEGGYETAKHKIEAAEQASKGGSGDPPESQGDTPGEGDHPAAKNPPTQPVDKDAVTGSNGDVTLPCGHESYDPNEVPRDPPYTVSCSQCPGAWVVQDD